MNSQERVQLFQRAIQGLAPLEQKYPGHPPYVSIHNQLLYLVELASGRPADPRNLLQVNLGVLTVHEVELRDEHEADLLYAVSEEVDRMKAEYGLPVE